MKLKLDDLQVDTFQTTPAPGAKGTVFGEQCTCYTQCTCPGCPTCANYNSCDATCNGSCAATCAASCNGTCVNTYVCYFTCDLSCQGYTCPTAEYPRECAAQCIEV